MIVKWTILFSVLFSNVLFSETAEEIKARAQEKLESGLEHAGLGAIGVGVGTFGVMRGDPVSSAVMIGGGIYEFKEAAKDFHEAKGLFEHSRELE